jgi:glycerol-3-phosphate cytidylyltransferase-like family protein
VSLIIDLLNAIHIIFLEEAAKNGEVAVVLLLSIAIKELKDTVYIKDGQRLDSIKNSCEDISLTSRGK